MTSGEKCIIVVAHTYEAFVAWRERAKPAVRVIYASSPWHLRGLGNTHRVVVLSQPGPAMWQELAELRQHGVEIEVVK